MSGLHRAILVAVLYVVAVIGLDLASGQFVLSTGIIVFYPPAGLYLAATLLLGPRALPLAFLSPLFNLQVTLAHQQIPFVGAMVLSALSMMSGALAWGALRLLQGRHVRLLSLRDAVVFAGVVTGAAAVEALVATSLYVPLGISTWEQYPANVLGWWISIVIPYLTVTPAIVLLFRPSPHLLSSTRRAVVAVLALVVAPLSAWVAFHGAPDSQAARLYLCLIPVVASALAGRVTGGLWASVGVMFSIFVLGPTFLPDPVTIVEAQLFLVVLTLTGLLTGVAVETENRSADSLAAEKERLAVTLRSIGDGVIAADRSGKVLLLNRAAERLTGWSAAEAEGRALGEVFNVVDAQSGAPCESPVERIVSTGGMVEVDSNTMLLARDGRRMLIADSGAPIRDKDSAVVGAVLVFRDVTDRQKMVERLQHSQRVDALGVLAGGIAHDFNNLLTGLFGFMELARMSTNDPEVQGYLAMGAEPLGRARNLTRQLLTFSKGGMPVKRSGQLEPIVRNTVAFALSGSHCTSEFQFPSSLPDCDFDPNQIELVIDNVVINAKQAMEDRGRIRVCAAVSDIASATHPVLRAGRYVSLAISDSGPGIAPHVLPRIFEPFFTTKVSGSGLGLATSFAIMRKHGGTLEADSRRGDGAVFTLWIPVATGGEGMVEEPKAPKSGAPLTHGSALVLDDEEYVRELLRSMLGRLGYSVTAVATGEQAAAVAIEHARDGVPFDILVLDLTIRGARGGKDTMRRLRSDLPNVCAMAISGYSEDPVIASPQEYGFSGSLRKPFTFDELRAAIERARADRTHAR